jgi:DNA-binding MarR family transcriptional regulator
MHELRHRRAAAANAPSDIRAALDAFRRIVQALRADGRPRNGLTSAQLFALQRIAEHPHLSINDVAALTFTHQSSVSVVVQRLVRRGLVAGVRARDDRRRRSLALTAAGRRLLRGAPVAVQERLIDAIRALPIADRRALARSLGAVARSVALETLPHPPMFFEDHARPRRRALTAQRT